MNRRARSVGIVLFPLLLINTMALADVPATQPTEQQQIQQLQSRVDQLEARQTATTRPAAGNVVKSPVTATWDGSRFQLSAFDGNFTLHPSVTLDIRDIVNYRTSVPTKGAGEVAATGYDTQNGVDLSRARFLVDGTLFHQVGYYVQISADEGAGLTVLDAYANYHFGDSPFTLQAGQFKDPVWHERNISEANLLAVDRSLLEYFLAGGQGSRVQGFSLNYNYDRVRAQLVAHDGFNSQNVKFFHSGGDGAGVGGESGVTPTDFGFSGRGEYMLIGNRTPDFNPYTEYDQFTSLGARQNILVVGAGADYTQAGANYLIAHSADVQFNSPCGFSAYAAYVATYRSLDANQGVPPGHYYDPGFQAQAAYVIGQRIEPYVRYDWIHLDPSSTKAVSGINSHLIQELTAGANYYLYGQKLKLTLDGSWLPNGSPGDADALGVLRDSGHYEFLLRTQVQLSI